MTISAARKTSLQHMLHGKALGTLKAVSNTCRVATGHSLSPLLGPALLLKALTSLLVLPNVSFMLTSKQLIVPRHASLTISTTTKPKDCRSSFAACMQT